MMGLNGAGHGTPKEDQHVACMFTYINNHKYIQTNVNTVNTCHVQVFNKKILAPSNISKRKMRVYRLCATFTVLNLSLMTFVESLLCYPPSAAECRSGGVTPT